LTTKGKFVALEGGDANGKQTQSKLLAAKLNALLISFPRYETEIGKAILGNLKGEWSAAHEIPDSAEPFHGSEWEEDDVNSLVRQALFTLDRYDAAPAIKDALASGRNVVADRYWLSGLVYGASDLVDAGMLERVHECLPQPDVWVLLDVPAEESFRRRPERQDVYERDREKMEDIRKRYIEHFQVRSRFVHKGSCLVHAREALGVPRASCTCDVRSWQIVDGVGTIEQVHERVMEAIK
jgi:dTMP kinase